MMTDQSRKQELYDEITTHLLEDLRPSEYLNQMAKESEFNEQPFQMLIKLKNTEQSPRYHPEGNVWNHTMLVLDEAAAVRKKSREPLVFMWAALLHDIGKPDTTRNKKGKITSYEHDTVGAELCFKFLQYFNVDEEFIGKVSKMVKYHMHMLYVLKDLSFGNVKKLINEVDVEEIALLCRCDRLGRTGVDRAMEEENYHEFLKRLQAM